MTCNTYELVSPDEVDTFLEHFPNCAIIKVEGRVEIPASSMRVGFIRVNEHRPASNRVTELTGIKHEVPQRILFVNGEARHG